MILLGAMTFEADSVEYFRWKKSRGGYEKHNGKDHYGVADARVFSERAELGRVLKQIK